MREKEIREGLADLAQIAEQDHEVQMARADLYKIAKYAIKLHDMLKSVSEAQGLEGWQQAKITKASDYISAVYHNLDYEMKFNNIDASTNESRGEYDHERKLDRDKDREDGYKFVPVNKRKKPQVKDRKTGKMYDPDKEFEKLKNSPEFKAQMKRMAKRDAVGEGVFDKLKSAPHVAKAGVASNKGDLQAVKVHVSNAVPNHITGDDREKLIKKHYANISKATKNTNMKTILKKMSEEVELDEISAKLARSARDKAKASELDYKIKAYNKISKTKNIPVISKLGKKAAEPDIKMADRRKRQANLANRKLGGMGDYEYDDKGKYRRQGPAKVLAKEEVELGEATDFRAGDTVYQVGSKLKGTVQHKGNRDLIAVKFGSVNQMIPASKLRLVDELSEGPLVLSNDSSLLRMLDMVHNVSDAGKAEKKLRGESAEGLDELSGYKRGISKRLKESIKSRLNRIPQK